MRKLQIAIIDSGIDVNHERLTGCRIDGICLEHDRNKDIVLSDDYNDIIGHGTAVAGIIHKHNSDAELYAVRIFKDSGGVSENLLIEAIRHCLEKHIDIINVSVGVQTSNPLAELADICYKACKLGIIIIAAGHNNVHLECYPGFFPSVFGVTAGKPIKSTEYGYQNGSPIEFVAKGDLQRVAWKDGSYNITGGTSFACAHFTGIVSNHLSLCNKKTSDDLRLELIKNAVNVKPSNNSVLKLSYNSLNIQGHDIDTIGNELFAEKNRRWIGRIALFPVSEKEMNTFIEFPELCRYPISKRLDYPRNFRKNNSNIKIDTSLLSDSDCKDFNTIIIGYFHDHMFEANVKYGYDLLNIIINNSKNIYLFDSRLKMYIDEQVKRQSYSGTVYLPEVNQELFEKVMLFQHLPDVIVPVISVVGTSNRQGKFTTQLCIRELLEKEGYKISHIATEPHAELFGASFVFPYGYMGTVKIDRVNWLPFLRNIMKGIQAFTSPQIILTGTQSGVMPRTYNHIGDISTSIDFIFGIQPDAFICAINPQDTIEQIKDVIDIVKIYSKAKLLFCVLTPMERKFRDINSGGIFTQEIILSSEEYLCKLNYFRKELKTDVINILNKENGKFIIESVENAFASVFKT